MNIRSRHARSHPAAHPRPLPDPSPNSSPSPTPPPNRHRSRIAATALLTACALTVTALTGCGLALRKGTQEAVRVAAEAVC